MAFGDGKVKVPSTNQPPADEHGVEVPKRDKEFDIPVVVDGFPTGRDARESQNTRALAVEYAGRLDPLTVEDLLDYSAKIEDYLVNGKPKSQE